MFNLSGPTKTHPIAPGNQPDVQRFSRAEASAVEDIGRDRNVAVVRKPPITTATNARSAASHTDLGSRLSTFAGQQSPSAGSISLSLQPDSPTRPIWLNQLTGPNQRSIGDPASQTVWISDTDSAMRFRKYLLHLIFRSSAPSQRTLPDVKLVYT